MNFKTYLFTIVAFLFLPTFYLFHFGQESDPMIMTINNNKITKSEFLRVYLKNNNDPKFDKVSLDEYMDLYQRFRLKVAEAEALGYDTIPALVRELNGYKEQLAQPYLIDTSKSKELVQEAFERMKYEIKAAHILIKADVDAFPDDTLKAYNKALALKDRILKGEDFTKVAKESSEDPSVAKNGGELGYFTAFQMVYPFETLAYETKVGEVAGPVRTSFGYHIIKVEDKRKARGTIHTAHIMILADNNANRSDIERAEQKINEIYEKLNEGEDFAKLARIYSEDRGSKDNGGELPAFGSGTNQRMVTEFEDAAFNLKNDGDYSKPFRTSYGFHIVRRLNYQPLGTFKELEPQISQKLKQGDRSKEPKSTFIEKLKRENNFIEKGKQQLSWFYKNIDSTVFTRSWEAPKVKKNSTLFEYNKQKYTSQDFIDYLTKQRNYRKMSVEKFIDQKYLDWQNEEIINDEKSQLTDKYPQYKALVQEYHDGILLYEIMKDKVWDKAIKDTAGLQQFFTSNISKYQWAKRAEVTIYSSEKEKMVKEAEVLSKIDSLKMNDIVKRVNSDSELNISGEYGVFEIDSKDIFKKANLKPGSKTKVKDGDKHYLIIVHEVLPSGPKKLSETRGAVIQDYQIHLEESWMEELRKKHKITIDKNVLYKLGG